MSDALSKFHESWIGMVQPIEGLVVSVPVLVDAQVGRPDEAPAALQARLLALCPPTRTTETGDAGHRIADLPQFLAELLGLGPELFDAEGAIPEELSLYVPEGQQTLRPTLALRKLGTPEEPAATADTTPASRAGSRYVALVWDLGEGLPLDKPETRTGPWDYPPGAKLDRLLRHARVPVGLLTNREVVRLVYAPHGESSGHVDFKIDDMATVGGRPILDALVSLLSATRFFGVSEEHALPALLAESRKRQANVTTELAEQVFEALSILLRGFAAAAERDPHYKLVFDEARAREGDHLYKGLLAVLLRLVFLLYAEDRSLMPMERPLYSEGLSVLALFDRLQRDRGAHPDSMSRRFGAWGRLLALFRAVYLGADHGELHMPARRGALFDPHLYPFLEGWGPAGSAPIVEAEARAGVHVPTLDDETVFRVLEKLVMFEGQRLSYKTLDVEQIGSVYEALMGYHVVPVDDAAVCLKPDGVWVTVREVLESESPRARAKWLKDRVGLATAQAEKLAKQIAEAQAGGGGGDAIRDVLLGHARGGRQKDLGAVTASAGQLVLQPGEERRRTSSHYTPRSLSAPIVKRTLEPLLACMGEAPASDRILDLTICDPAMGSGAFLVEACRFLADQVVAAWTREGKLEAIAHEAPNEDPVLYARRLVAQRCLYGVDKNESAVELAKLSLWLVTLARDLPFTFLDHSLRHGDSLVGLSFDQIKAFHWKPEKQIGLAEGVLREALEESVAIRKRIQELARDGSAEAQREKERLRGDAEDASSRARLIGDVVVGAFFAKEKDKEREKERKRRLDVVAKWIGGDESAGDELREMQREIRARLPVFHWMLEFPEVFFAERPDPLDENRVNRAAFMDAFVGNPPFMGQSQFASALDEMYGDWLSAGGETGGGKADLVAYFLRRTGSLIGAHGAIGLIASTSISQGESRDVGLKGLLNAGFAIFRADSAMQWPGEASVQISVVHLAVGSPLAQCAARWLDGALVQDVNSRLEGRPEQPDPTPLQSNDDLIYLGCKIGGQGFLLEAGEAEALLRRHENADRIRMYIGGDDLNGSPTQESAVYVIDFGQLTEAEAARWPELLAIVRDRVKPYRDGVNRESWRKRWWQFAEVYPAMRAAIAPLKRCLVIARDPKHFCFSFQPTDRVLNEKLYVIPLASYTAFAVLQSRIHVNFAMRMGRLTGGAGTVSYSATECFRPFPFPMLDPRIALPALERVGEHLYRAREEYMADTSQGLTRTYNRLKHPDESDARIQELRRLHEQTDRAVLDAYGWTDIQVPPFCPTTDAEVLAVEVFSDAVVDGLFVLNAERARNEAWGSLAVRADREGTRRSRSSKRRNADSAQQSLIPSEEDNT